MTIIREFIRKALAAAREWFTGWLAERISEWVSERRWVLVAIAAIGAIALRACSVVPVIIVATTLSRCGCSSPVPTPTPSPSPYPTVPPTVTAMPSPTPTPVWEPTPSVTPTPQPATDLVTDTQALLWDLMFNVSPVALDWGWDKDCNLVVIDTASGHVYTTTCGGVAYHYTASDADAYPRQVYTTTCGGELVYRYVIDIEVRQDGEVVRSDTHVMALTAMTVLAGTPMPTTGQYDGDLPWQISLVGLTGRLEVWERGQWVPNCDALPMFITFQAGTDGLVLQDEQGFSLVGVYEK